jgi:hypothetical protein
MDSRPNLYGISSSDLTEIAPCSLRLDCQSPCLLPGELFLRVIDGERCVLEYWGCRRMF